MAWSLRDTADVLEAESELKGLIDHRDTDDLFFDLVFRITRDEKRARKALHSRILNRKWAQTDGV